MLAIANKQHFIGLLFVLISNVHFKQKLLSSITFQLSSVTIDKM